MIHNKKEWTDADGYHMFLMVSDAPMFSARYKRTIHISVNDPTYNFCCATLVGIPQGGVLGYKNIISHIRELTKRLRSTIRRREEE